MSVIIDVSTRGRMCRECTDEIPAGEYHLRFSAGRGRFSMVDNICPGCLTDMIREIHEKNREVIK